MKTKLIALISACLLGGFISQAQTKKAVAGGSTFGIRAGILGHLGVQINLDKNQHAAITATAF